MTSGDIRKNFLDFFGQKGHVIVPSDLLVPVKDPTLLFTGAGMNQFKEQFMGKGVTYTRAASSQKCIRTGDLENVGRTPRHHTFFEMLGNFSFGDYFKTEAITWAWEFMTGVLNIPAEKLRVSVHRDDQEAYGIWLGLDGMSEDKMIRLGDHDNFWPADAPKKGPNGPCGPCSEIFYDRGKDAGCGGSSCGPICGCGRFVEIWNLVFTEFERKEDGKLYPLPCRNIDTGMGLERICSVMQGVRTNFETDLFIPIVEAIRDAVGEKKGSDTNLIADHLRAATFAIADGVSPSNEKRGYVVRKLIRRAWLKGNVDGAPFLYKIVPVVSGIFREQYPEIDEKSEHIAAIMAEEEKRFNETLRGAMPVLEDMVLSGIKVLSGDKIFKLVDTYGLPVELIKDVCEGKGVEADLVSFELYMKKRKEQSRKGSDIKGEFIFQPDLFKEAPRPEYSRALPLKAEIVFVVKSGRPADEIREGEEGEIITSPQSGVFYAEGGGQVGDTGSLKAPDALASVLNTFGSDGRKIYQVRVDKGRFRSGDIVRLDLDASKKSRTAANHTATHLLHAALRKVLGDHIKQSGSLVDHRHLRFDFTHMKKLSPSDTAKVQDLVNSWIDENIDVCKETKPVDQARQEGALSFFGEKYGETVRVITVGERSKELCGGTHVSRTGDIRIFKIISESSVASGIRRIEALTGDVVEAWIKEELRALMSGINAEVIPGEDTRADDLLSNARNIIDGRVKVDGALIRHFDHELRPGLVELKEKSERSRKKALKENENEKLKALRLKLDDAAREREKVGGVSLISDVLENADMGILRKAVSYLEKRERDSIVILGGALENKAYIVCAVPEKLVKDGMSAREIVSCAAVKIRGSGGGKDSFAQAGGEYPQGLADFLFCAKGYIEKRGENEKCQSRE